MINALKAALAGLVLATFSLGAWAAVDFNKASQAELESVKGIGPAMSTRLLEARKAGTFKDWNDVIDRVQGIGPAKAAKLSGEGMTVNGATYAAVAAPKPAKGDKATKPAKDAKPQAAK